MCLLRLLDKLKAFPLIMIINEGYESSQLYEWIKHEYRDADKKA